MLALATSVLHEYPLIWKGDPALKQPEVPPEAEPFPDEDPAAFEARKEARDKAADKAREDFERAWVRCIETGRWDDLKRPDAQPTVFWCRQLTGAVFRGYMDYVAAHDQGGWTRPALAFRLAVVRIDNFAPGFKVERAEHTRPDGAPSGLGLALPVAVTDALDGVDEAIVSALGFAILAHRRGPHPL